MFIGRRHIAFNALTFKLSSEKLTPTSEFPTPIAAKPLNLQPKLAFPFGLQQTPSLKRLILRGKELKVEGRRAVVEEDDKILLAMRSFDREGSTHVAMNQLEESGAARTRGRGIWVTGVFPQDARLTSRKGVPGQKLSTSYRLHQLTSGLHADVTQTMMPEIQRNGDLSEAGHVRRCPGNSV
jgi:hypothetical protein